MRTLLASLFAAMIALSTVGCETKPADTATEAPAADAAPAEGAAETPAEAPAEEAK